MEKIPPEMLGTILSFESPVDILSFCVLNKRFNNLCKNEGIWRSWALANNINIPEDVNPRQWLLSTTIYISGHGTYNKILTKEMLAGFYISR